MKGIMDRQKPGSLFPQVTTMKGHPYFSKKRVGVNSYEISRNFSF